MSNKRYNEYMDTNKVSINEFEEKTPYNERETNIDTLTNWDKRNAQEIVNTKMLDNEQFFFIIDENCKIEYCHPRALDDKGNLTEFEDTSKPKRLVFTFKDGLNSDTYYKLYVRPQRLQALYMTLEQRTSKWDTVFEQVTFTRSNLVTVNTNFRRFNSGNIDNLKDSKFAFLCYEGLDKDSKPVIRKFTTYDEKSDTYYNYNIVIMDSGASLELVSL